MTKGETCIFLGRGNRMHLVGRLEAGEGGNREDHMEEGRTEGEMTAIGEHLKSNTET